MTYTVVSEITKPVKIEIVQDFDYGKIPATMRSSLMDDTAAIEKEMQSTARSLYRVGEIVHKWRLAMKDTGFYGAYTEWLTYCFKRSKSYAYQAENVFVKFRDRDVQLLHAFDSQSLQLLCGPAVPAEVFESAIALADAGQFVSKDRAQLLKQGNQLMTVAEGDQVAIRNPRSPYYKPDEPIVGKVYALDPKHSQLDLELPDGEIIRITAWEINPSAPLPPAKAKHTPSPIHPPSQNPDTQRLSGLEVALEKLIAAARLAIAVMPAGVEKAKLELAVGEAEEWM